MAVRSFPRTRNKPQKRILLIPFILMFGGWAMTFIQILQFIGSIIALTGALTTFLVGAVFADLWAAERRTRQMIEARRAEGQETQVEDIETHDIKDPFEETYDEE
ncbi:MAG: hypothetical protein JW779_04590 [Candidatus Thorarchaeota archaeon]|nr:hypothetical protein [Candidatus Thorarchaeota archaeon]